MKHLKNSIFIFLIIILLSVFISPILSLNVYAVEDTDNSNNILDIDKSDIHIEDANTAAPSCMLIDAKTSEILYSKDAYKKMYPASTTKLMTAILVLENCSLNDIVTISHNAIFSIPVGYSHANLKEGEKLTVEQLLNVLLIPSANDAAIALAEHVAGSVEEFSIMMNNKAKDLGCISTNFVNPNGIHDKNHYSCAYDLALIGKYAMQFTDIMRISKIRQYTLPITNKYDKSNRIFNATNALLNNESLNKYYYKYATGLKTGYTDASGSCIVATAKKNDIELLAVVLKGNSINSRYVDCKTLFEYGFNNYSYTTILKSDEIIKTVNIGNATEETKNLEIIAKDDINLLLKKDIKIDNIEPKIEIDQNLKAPIVEKSVVGKVIYELNGKEYSSDLIAGANVYPSSFEIILFRLLLIFLILYILYRLLQYTGKKKPRKKDKIVKKKKSKKSQYKEKGNYKFTQINDYL